MRVLVVLTLAACEFQHGSATIDGAPSTGSGSGSGSGSSACWSYSPTNFDPCALPAPSSLRVTADVTVNVDTTSLPKLVVQQPDGSKLTVIHLSDLDVDDTRVLTVTGSTPVAFAVEGAVTLEGYINAASGIDDALHCMTSKGGAGTDSADGSSGGGGGAGGGGAATGGRGTNGSGTSPGTGAAATTATTTNLSPMRGGCSGGPGGKLNGAGVFGAAGRGGGGVQISTNESITLGGAVIDAAGRGGKGGPDIRTGGGGGGAGGAIFLEGPAISIAATALLCADGGSGGEGGGGALATGYDGNTGRCNGNAYATTEQTFNGSAGSGGNGSFKGSPLGGSAGTATGQGGGGGGGGAVGWIRLKSPALTLNSGATVTPAPQTN